jgi:hypothetical protein
LLLVTRLHARTTGTFDVYANGSLIDRQWIPELPGSWLEVVTLIPGAQITADHTEIRIVPQVAGGHYIPYQHWAYQGSYMPPSLDNNDTLATFGNTILLRSAALDSRAESKQLAITLLWDTVPPVEGDYKVFVHVLDAAGNIAAQTDVRPGNGTLPPGNWLPGVLQDTIMVDLSQVPTGTYRVAIGLYQPVTFERLAPSGGDETGRLVIGDVEVDG